MPRDARPDGARWVEAALRRRAARDPLGVHMAARESHLAELRAWTDDAVELIQRYEAIEQRHRQLQHEERELGAGGLAPDLSQHVLAALTDVIVGLAGGRESPLGLWARETFEQRRVVEEALGDGVAPVRDHGGHSDG